MSNPPQGSPPNSDALAPRRQTTARDSADDEKSPKRSTHLSSRDPSTGTLLTPTVVAKVADPPYVLSPEQRRKIKDDLAADSLSTARERASNSIESVPSRPVPPDPPEVAASRSFARQQLDREDPFREERRRTIDAMRPGELALLSSATDRKQADAVYEHARDRLERASAQVEPRKVFPPLEDRFNVYRHLLSKDYEFRDRPGRVAFTEHLNTLRSADQAPAVAIGMMDRAVERGWDAVRVSGTAEFQRQVWIAATARGIMAIDYEPTQGDRDTAAAERQRLGPEQSSQARQARSLHRPEAPEAAKDSSSDLGSRVVATASVMRAFDLVMDRQKVPSEQQIALRAELTRQLDAMTLAGKSPVVKIYDERAPRRADITSTSPAPRRETGERVR